MTLLVNHLKHSVKFFTSKKKIKKTLYLIQAHRFSHWEKQTKLSNAATYGVKNHMSDSHGYIRTNIAVSPHTTHFFKAAIKME